jgi:hypothetical protein
VARATHEADQRQAAFCTISLLARLVMTAKPSAVGSRRCAIAPISLSRALTFHEPLSRPVRNCHARPATADVVEATDGAHAEKQSES